MPLGDESIFDARSVAFFNAVFSHDVQNAQTNIVAVAATSGDELHGHSRVLSRSAVRVFRRDRCQATGDDFLQVRHIFPLVVVPFVPRQLLGGG